MKTVGIIGAGAWGTALAVIANRAGCAVSIWSRNQEVVQNIQEKNHNDQYLPNVFLDPAIHASGDLREVCQNELILLAVPAQYLRSTAIMLSDQLDKTSPLVICSKGIERGSLYLMSEVLASVLPNNPVAVLSGPNFAHEAASGLPTATSIACVDKQLGEQIVFTLGSSLFRPYLSSDVIGTQIGGATKNVIAIACGIAMGKDLGENARAALITRGIAEMRRLCKAKGGRDETLMGLSGVGDLILTCSSTKSRNTSVGYFIGQGDHIEDILSRQEGVAEGVASAEAVVNLADSLDVDMPICQAVSDVLLGNLDVDDAIRGLLGRPFALETL